MYVSGLVGRAQLPATCPLDGCNLRYQGSTQWDLVSTTDAGRDWDVHGLPTLSSGKYTTNYMPGQSYVQARYAEVAPAAGAGGDWLDLSCPRPGECWVSGPGPVGILWTTDGGIEWSRQNVGGQQGLFQVSCPEPNQCVALGAPTARTINQQTFEYASSVPV
jgi:hypothetical protein